jgi:HlyD family secretion protein
LRANYSANADIILEHHERVLAISESLLQFEKGKPYVEVEVAPQRFERKNLELGLSDGINVEIKSGIDAKAKIKVPESAGSDDQKGGSGAGKGRGGGRRWGS